MSFEKKLRYDPFERKKILEWSQQTLWDEEKGEPGRTYLFEKRKIKEETVRKFGLGFVPSFADNQLTNRIIFPIFDASNNLIAISTRLIEGESSLPVYWHERFNKSFYLYGINLAKKRIRKTKFVLILEGNFDVIKCYDEGLTNVVGLLGTAVSDIQLALVLRYCEDVIFVFDNDENQAGQKGSKRAAEKIGEYTINTKDDYRRETLNLISAGFVTLDEKDPDEYVKKYGILAFKQLVKKELDKIRRTDV